MIGIRSTAAAALQRMAAMVRPRAAAYDAAGQGRRQRGWNPTVESVNSILWGSADELRRRSRDAARKNPWIVSGLHSFAVNAIGTGIKPQPKHPDADARIALQENWTALVESADFYGVTDLYGLQSQAVVAVKEAGEVFGRLHVPPPALGLRVPLQVQLLEAEHVPTHFHQVLAGGGYIKSGIEFDAAGRRTAYHVYREHPGESFPVSPLQLVRIPAAEMIHVYEPRRPGQIRGIPGVAPVLLRAYEFDQYEQGELVRKRDASMFSGFIEEPTAGGASPLRAGATTETDPTTGKPIEVVELQPGTFPVLRPGEKVTLAEPSDMGQGYEEFLIWALRAIAAGLGVTYEQLTGDLSGVNYSSIRAGLVEFRRAMEAFQHSIFVHQFCRPIHRAFVVNSILAGNLPVRAGEFRRDPAPWLATKWVPQGWAWVDPQKEITAMVAAIRAGLLSRSEAISMYGYDAEEIDAEIARDNARADALGLSFDSDPRKVSQAGVTQARATGTPALPSPDAPGNEEEQSQEDKVANGPSGRAAKRKRDRAKGRAA